MKNRLAKEAARLARGHAQPMGTLLRLPVCAVPQRKISYRREAVFAILCLLFFAVATYLSCGGKF